MTKLNVRDANTGDFVEVDIDTPSGSYYTVDSETGELALIDLTSGTGNFYATDANTGKSKFIDVTNLSGSIYTRDDNTGNLVNIDLTQPTGNIYVSDNNTGELVLIDLSKLVVFNFGSSGPSSVIGVQVTPFLVTNGVSSIVNCGSDAGLDDLHAAAFTVEGWFCPNTTGEGSSGVFFTKGYSVGWRLLFVGGNTLQAGIMCATPATASVSHTPNQAWHHYAITYDANGDRKVRIWIDGALMKTSGAAAGAVTSDAAASLLIGNRSSASLTFDGNIGWVRVSSVVRYISEFTPVRREAPPSVDASTVAQWNMRENSGTVVDNVQGAATRDGILSNVSWPGDYFLGDGTNLLIDSLMLETDPDLMLLE